MGICTAEICRGAFVGQFAEVEKEEVLFVKYRGSVVYYEKHEGGIDFGLCGGDVSAYGGLRRGGSDRGSCGGRGD